MRPILDGRFARLPHSAALIGYGSDVLGYDTEQSTDHEWGPRVLLFLSEEDHARRAAAIREALATELPPEFLGYSTDFGEPDVEGIRSLASGQPGRIRHHVEVQTVRRFWLRELGIEPDAPLGAIDWLCFPEQRLLAVTAGAVYFDGLRTLEPLRARFAYYPRDVWLYLLSAQWRRISQEEAFMGRCGDVGDDLGSRLVAARLVRDAMKLCFLMERRYAPYAKWLGTAFARLACAARLTLAFAGALGAATWHERERALSEAYVVLMETHNALRITPPLTAGVSPFHGRPYFVPHAGRFDEAIQAAITNPEVLAIIAANGPIGGIDQFADSTDVLSRPAVCNRIKQTLMPPATEPV